MSKNFEFSKVLQYSKNFVFLDENLNIALLFLNILFRFCYIVLSDIFICKNLETYLKSQIFCFVKLY